MSSTAVIANFKQVSYTSFLSCFFICSLSKFCDVLLEFAYFEYNERHIIESSNRQMVFNTHLLYFQKVRDWLKKNASSQDKCNFETYKEKYARSEIPKPWNVVGSNQPWDESKSTRQYSHDLQLSTPRAWKQIHSECTCTITTLSRLCSTTRNLVCLF